MMLYIVFLKHLNIIECPVLMFSVKKKNVKKLVQKGPKEPKSAVYSLRF